MDTLTMNIKREFFAAIVNGTKKTEYRSMSDYWKDRIEPLSAPFKLRLLNGMKPPVPEAIVMVTQVTRDPERAEYQLHLGEILEVMNWNEKGEQQSKTRKSRQHVPLIISPALAGIIGPGNKSKSEIIKLFWKYLVDHNLQVDGDEDEFRVDSGLRELVGPRERVTLEEIVERINENIQDLAT